MTDLAKRRTLKGMAAVAAGSATAGLATQAFAGTDGNAQKLPSQATEGHLAIQTRISPRANDIEAVFINAGDDTLNIESLTPHGVTTFRGKFDVAALTANKPLVLAPGESVSVHMTPHGDRMKLNELMLQGQSLSRVLQTSATATTTQGVPIHITVNETRPFA